MNPQSYYNFLRCERENERKNATPIQRLQILNFDRLTDTNCHFRFMIEDISQIMLNFAALKSIKQ